MSIEEISLAVAVIKQEAKESDYETAHIREDQLRDTFIKYVASLGNPSLAAKAKLVLSTNTLKHERWYA